MRRERPADWVYVSYFDPDGGYRALELRAGRRQDIRRRRWRRPSTVSPTRCRPRSPPTTTSSSGARSRRSSASAARTRWRRCAARRRRRTSRFCARPAGIAVAPILDGKVVKQRRVQFRARIAAPRGAHQDRRAGGGDRADPRRAAGRGEGAPRAPPRPQRADRRPPGARRARRDKERRSPMSPAWSAISRRPAAISCATPGCSSPSPAHESVKVPVGTIGDARLARYRVHVMAASGPTAERPSSRRRTRPTPTSSAASSSARAATGNRRRSCASSPAPCTAPTAASCCSTRARCSARPPSPRRSLRALEAQEIRFDPPADPVGVDQRRDPRPGAHTAQREARRSRRRRRAAPAGQEPRRSSSATSRSRRFSTTRSSARPRRSPPTRASSPASSPRTS